MKKILRERKQGNMLLTPRQEKRVKARTELNKFILDWQQKHDLCLEDMIYIFSHELNTQATYLVKT